MATRKRRAQRSKKARSDEPRGAKAQNAAKAAKGAMGAMDAALAMLARRSHPAARVRERLARRFAAAEVDVTIARLEELGVLDDRRYAETFVRDRFERAGYGRERIGAELAARGVAREHVEAAIAAVVDGTHERERAAGTLAHFRARRTKAQDERKAREAAFRHLIGRGFPLDLVRDLLAVDEVGQG